MDHAVQTREFEAPAHTRRQPTVRFTQKHLKTLGFDSPRLLTNRLGEKFDIKIDLFEEGKICKISLSSRERAAGEMRVEITLIAFPEENSIIISAIKQGSEDYISYDKPPEENKGYGLMRLALAFARSLARKEGATEILTSCPCSAVRERYKKFGFVPTTSEDGWKARHDLILHLQQ